MLWKRKKRENSVNNPENNPCTRKEAKFSWAVPKRRQTTNQYGSHLTRVASVYIKQTKCRQRDGLVNLIPNSETMSLSGKQSDLRKRWVVKLLKIHAQKKRGTNNTVSWHVFDSYIYLERRSLRCRGILGGRKLLVYARTVETAIFDVMTDEN